MLSYANISSAPVLTGNSSGFYHTLGVLAIICGIVSLLLVILLTTPSVRESRPRARKSSSFRWIRKDPWQDNWARQQATFLTQVLESEPDTIADTIVPGAVPIPAHIPVEDSARPIVTVRPLVGVVVAKVPEEPRDGGELVLAQIRQSNAEFLASLDSI